MALGYAMWMADEQKLAALGSVAGAGPAYVARFIAALAKAGMRRGLSEDIAATIAAETVFGTAWMAVASGESMESVAKRVASPKGTTQPASIYSTERAFSTRSSERPSTLQPGGVRSSPKKRKALRLPRQSACIRRLSPKGL